MCWSATASVAMVGLGAAATLITARRGESRGIWLTLGYFTIMEALQVAGYGVLDQCGAPANRAVTLLSYLHIAFQPFFVNAFCMAILPDEVPARTRRVVWGVSAACTAVLLVQILPLEALGQCRPGTYLCGPALCTVSGSWHIGWEVPLNGLFSSLHVLGLSIQFPSYLIGVFVVPLFYGAWRFVLFQALTGPTLAMALTSDPNEMPAIWCLFSIGLLLIGLSPALRRPIAGPARLAS